jgi:hypothetical protein
MVATACHPCPEANGSRTRRRVPGYGGPPQRSRSRLAAMFGGSPGQRVSARRSSSSVSPRPLASRARSSMPAMRASRQWVASRTSRFCRAAGSPIIPTRWRVARPPWLPASPEQWGLYGPGRDGLVDGERRARGAHALRSSTTCRPTLQPRLVLAECAGIDTPRGMVGRMEGDRVDAILEAGEGVRTFDIVATRAGVGSDLSRPATSWGRSARRSSPGGGTWDIRRSRPTGGPPTSRPTVRGAGPASGPRSGVSTRRHLTAGAPGRVARGSR